jgi:signal transduction histidine kinase
MAMVIRRAIMPFGGWMEAVQRVEAGDYTAQAPERGPRDLRRFARAFNSMIRRLQAETEQRRRLMADVTHELRTPLTTIQGQIEGMIDGVYPADEAHLAPLLNETRVLSRLIDDLRTLSLAESGALNLRREVTDLEVLIGETVAAFRDQAGLAGVRLEPAFTNDLPLIPVDPVRIREVLTNLLTNALRYTPAGGAVTVTCVADATSVTVSVQDTGAGIAPEDLPHVFDRFYRSGESGGSGLGLAIARSLVEAQGGEIQAASEQGKGTSISFRLPQPD